MFQNDRRWANTVDGAIMIAVNAHSGQTDKAGLPYITHPMRVMSQFRDDPTLQMIAVMHDVFEDSDFTRTHLAVFGWSTEILDAVEALTHHDDERLTDYYERVKANPLALQVKLADIADNSDPARLAYLDDVTRERLTKKYAKALKFFEVTE